MKYKILIKNKRLKPDVEKAEMDLFRSGQFVLGADGEKEDASAPANAAPQKDKPVSYFTQFYLHRSSFHSDSTQSDRIKSKRVILSLELSLQDW